MLGCGLISLEFQCKHNTPTHKEILKLDKYSIFNMFLYKSLNVEEYIENKQ